MAVLIKQRIALNKIHTWEDYRHAARKLKDIGVYIAADSGDASFYNAMIWLGFLQNLTSSAETQCFLHTVELWVLV